MLLRFSVRNFRSIRDEQELSLVASPLRDSKEGVSTAKGFDGGILRVAAIYGANASGKTNVLRALHFMKSAVVRSHSNWKPQQRVPRQHFRLDESSGVEPTIMEVDLLIDGVRYQYGFSIDSERVREEWCYAFPRGKRQLWFSRKPDSFRFGKSLTGAHRLIQEVTRENSLFVSAAAQSNHKQLLILYQWFDRQLTVVTSERSSLLPETIEACADGVKKRRVEQLLRAADLGLLGFDTVIEEHDERIRKVFSALRTAIPESLSDQVEVVDLPDRHTEIEFLHRAEKSTQVRFRSNAESDGTMTFFALLGPIVHALESSGTLCVDELDASLHPLLALEVVRMFNSNETNAGGAQLIFNTHDTNLLDPDSLRRDQIWFTEKDDAGVTHLYPLTDFKSRKDDNLRRGYLQGRYGAIPFLGGSLSSALSTAEIDAD
jgi:AAA15 family ATPase/GTPase